VTKRNVFLLTWKQVPRSDKPVTPLEKDLEKASCRWTVGLRSHIAEVMFVFACLQPTSDHRDPSFKIDLDVVAPEYAVKRASYSLSTAFLVVLRNIESERTYSSNDRKVHPLT
jgi:hypothetical protein